MLKAKFLKEQQILSLNCKKFAVPFNGAFSFSLFGVSDFVVRSVEDFNEFDFGVDFFRMIFCWLAPTNREKIRRLRYNLFGGEQI